MRSVYALATLGAIAGVTLYFLTRNHGQSTGRGDFDLLDPLDNITVEGDFTGPPDYSELPMLESDDPVFDPRDVLARRFYPSLMKPSNALIDWLKSKEKLTLTRYDLGDGGVTIGYGHFEPHATAYLVPESITADQAESIFDEDIEARGARWVRQYVSVPLLQNEFDALTSLAFNLSPRSFNQIAQSLNSGDDWRAVARTYVRPDLPNLTRGLQIRREGEIAMFDSGSYA